MSESNTLLAKARALTADARRLKDGQQGAAEIQRATNAITQTRLLVDDARRAALAHLVAESKGVALTLKCELLDDGRINLERHAADGLPSDQAFVAAQRKLKASVSRLNEDLIQGWRSWAGSHLMGLPLERLALLESSQREQAQQWLATLRTLEKSNPPTRGDIGQFENALALLQDLVQGLGGISEDVLTLLRRLGERPAPTLGDFTPDELTQLREAGLADQIELRRRGA